MKIFTHNGKNYRLPNSFNDFQQEIYFHLIDWKCAHITREAGYNRGNPYNANLERWIAWYRELYAVQGENPQREL